MKTVINYFLLSLGIAFSLNGMHPSIPDLKTLAARAVMHDTGLYTEAILQGTLPIQCHELIQAEKNKIKSLEPLITRLLKRCNQSILLTADRADMLEVAQQCTAAYLAMDTTCDKNSCWLGILANSLPWKHDFETSLALFKVAIGKKHIGHDNQCCFSNLFNYRRGISEAQRNTLLLAALPTLTKKQRGNLWEKYNSLLFSRECIKSFAAFDIPTKVSFEILANHYTNPQQLTKHQARKILLMIARGVDTEPNQFIVNAPFVLERAQLSSEEMTNLLTAVAALSQNKPLSKATIWLINDLINNREVTIPETLIKTIYSHSKSLVENDAYLPLLATLFHRLLADKGTMTEEESMHCIKVALETAYADSDGIIQDYFYNRNPLPEHHALQIRNFLHTVYLYSRILNDCHSDSIKSINFQPTPFASTLYEAITKSYCFAALQDSDKCFLQTLKENAFIQEQCSSLIANIIAADHSLESFSHYRGIFNILQDPSYFPLFNEALDRCPIRLNLDICDSYNADVKYWKAFKKYALNRLLEMIQRDKTLLTNLIYRNKIDYFSGIDKTILCMRAIKLLHQIIYNIDDNSILYYILSMFNSELTMNKTIALTRQELFSLYGHLIYKIKPTDKAMHDHCEKIVIDLLHELFTSKENYFGEFIDTIRERYPAAFMAAQEHYIDEPMRTQAACVTTVHPQSEPHLSTETAQIQIVNEREEALAPQPAAHPGREVQQQNRFQRLGNVALRLFARPSARIMMRAGIATFGLYSAYKVLRHFR